METMAETLRTESHLMVNALTNKDLRHNYRKNRCILALVVQHINRLGDYMVRQEITKEWIDKLADYRDSKWMHQNGSILMLPKDTFVAPDVMEYAKSRKCDIRFETKEPHQNNLDAVYTSYNTGKPQLETDGCA